MTRVKYGEKFVNFHAGRKDHIIYKIGKPRKGAKTIDSLLKVFSQPLTTQWQLFKVLLLQRLGPPNFFLFCIVLSFVSTRYSTGVAVSNTATPTATPKVPS